MRIVVASGGLRDVKQVEFGRHIEMLSRFMDGAQGEACSSRQLVMILRSADSSAALAVTGMSKALALAGISAKAIVAKLEPEDDLRQLFACLSELSPNDPAKDLIRWARNPRLLDAHEQVIYGTLMCWSGDPLRREPDKCNALSLFENAAPHAAQLGRQAFEALWRASSFIPERRLAGPKPARPSANYEPDASRMANLTRVRAGLHGWPLLRH